MELVRILPKVMPGIPSWNHMIPDSKCGASIGRGVLLFILFSYQYGVLSGTVPSSDMQFVRGSMVGNG